MRFPFYLPLRGRAFGPAVAALAMIILPAAPFFGAASARATEPSAKWIPLFNGKNLDGWTPKIVGYKAGENFGNTFRVHNGLLQVRYDQYDAFKGRFGHLFYKRSFSHYVLRVEYRFVGKQIAGGPGWAFRNSGIMIHGQTPESMRLDQAFPVSIEVQLLGGRDQGTRPTANLCTPGTHVVLGGRRWTRHCTNSRSATFRGDQWVTVEVEVHGSRLIRHKVGGQVVLEYERPQLDLGDRDARRLRDEDPRFRNASGPPILLESGTISLQSESHPIDFRRIEIRLLKPETPSRSGNKPDPTGARKSSR